ncbi:MAG TPA: DegV family protein [Candidatus Avimonas sp.]|nr:DegV family protein [Clostridiales bacterium]HPU58037.1 DegV family protein [Candidatus Avimonas sp.]
MAVRIITDSSCDHPFSIQKEWDIKIMPFKVIFGDDEYVDGQDLTIQQFYQLMYTATELPKTVQINPIEFEEVFKEYLDAGDEIVVLPISRHMSGTYNNALVAKEQFPGAPIYVVNTLNVTFGLGLLVEIAVRLRNQGLDAKSIAEQIESIKERVRLYAVVGDLKYLKMGGRLSSAGAVVGTLLGIKPIICIQEGKVIGIDKARGIKAGYQAVLSYAKKDGIDFSYPVYFGHSDFPGGMEELISLYKQEFEGWENGEIHASDIGPIVGTHAGPGCTGIAFIAK